MGNDPVNMVDPTGKRGILGDIVKKKAIEKTKAKAAAEGAEQTGSVDQQRQCQLEKCTPPRVSLSVCMITNCSEALMGEHGQSDNNDSTPSEDNAQERNDRKALDERVKKLREEREERMRESERENEPEPEEPNIEQNR